MTWATLAIAVMARQVLPSWPSTLAAGVLTGLAIATRTGGIITHAYLLGAMLLCATEFFAVNGRMTARYLVQIVMRCAAVVGIGWMTAIALWPWLQIGNPLQQFRLRSCTLQICRWRLNSLIGGSKSGPTPYRAPTSRTSCSPDFPRRSWYCWRLLSSVPSALR